MIIEAGIISGINRIRLEFKDHSGCWWSWLVLVLIESDWNLKYDIINIITARHWY